MIIEGKNVVSEALLAGDTINALYVLNASHDDGVQKIIDEAKKRKIKINFVSREILDKKSVLRKHQGVLADVVDFQYSSVSELLEDCRVTGHDPFFVVLDGIQDPHNMGAIIRTCECAGVNGVIIGKFRSVPVNETVIRTSAGATAFVKIARETNLNNTIDFLKKNGVWVYGAEAGGKNAEKVNLQGPIALVVGSEGEGISRLTKQKCDEIISLPLYGKINSLNASVAGGILIYEAVRQRNK